MQGFKIVDGLNCIKPNHLEEGIIGICVHLECKSKNRFFCFKCLLNHHHHHHIQDCIQFNFVYKFIDNAIQILQNSYKIQWTDEKKSNDNLYKQFFQRKQQKLEELKENFSNLTYIKQNEEKIEFAFNILVLQKQFVFGNTQIIQKELKFRQLEAIFQQNINLYIEEAICRCNNLKLNYLYEEAIQCCDMYLDLKLDQQLLEIKGNCLHFLDRLDEAFQIYQYSQQLFPNPEKFILHQYLIQQSFSYKFTYQNNPDAPKFLKIAWEVEKLIMESKPQEALKLLNECKYEDSAIHLKLSQKVNCLCLLKQFDEADQINAQLLNIYPRYIRAIQSNAFKLLRYGKYDELEQYVGLNKNKFAKTDSTYYLFQSYFQNSKFSEAIKIMDELPDEYKNSTQYQNIRFFLLKFYQNKNQWEPDTNDELRLLYQQGISHAQKKNFQEALKCFEVVSKHEPENLEVLKFKIYILLQLNKLNDAIQDFETMQSINSESIHVKEIQNLHPLHLYVKFNINYNIKDIKQLYDKAQILIQTKKYHEALKIYSQILILDNTQLEAKLKEILCFILNQNIQIAIGRIEDLLKYEQSCLEAYFLKGFALYKEQKYQAALDQFKNIQQKYPQYFLIEIQIANCYYKLQSYNDARLLYTNLFQKESQAILKQSFKVSIWKSIYRLRYQDANSKQYLKNEFDDLNKEINFFSKMEVCKNYLFFLEDDEYLNSANFKRHFELFINVARVYCDLKIPNVSIQIYDKILQQNPKNLLALIGITRAYKQYGNQLMANEFEKLALQVNLEAFNNQFQNDLLLDMIEQEIQFYDEEPFNLIGFRFMRHPEQNVQLLQMQV